MPEAAVTIGFPPTEFAMLLGILTRSQPKTGAATQLMARLLWQTPEVIYDLANINNPEVHDPGCTKDHSVIVEFRQHELMALAPMLAEDDPLFAAVEQGLAHINAHNVIDSLEAPSAEE